MSAEIVVIYAGSQVTSTIREKCNLGGILWIDVENPDVQPSELKAKNVLFISNKKLLSFLNLRKNRKWMALIADIAEEGTTENDLSRSFTGLQAIRAAVIFVALSSEDLDNGKDKFEGIEPIQVSTERELDTRVMERLALMSNATSCKHVTTTVTPPFARQRATAPLSNQDASTSTSAEGATAPTPSQNATAPILYQGAMTYFTTDDPTPTTPCSFDANPRPAPVTDITNQLPSFSGLGQHGSIVPQDQNQMNGRIFHNGSTLSSGHAMNNPNSTGYDTMSSYYIVTDTLDASRSLSSRGLDLGGPPSNHQAVPEGQISFLNSQLPETRQSGNVVAYRYIPIPVRELSMSGDEFGHTPHQGDSIPRSTFRVRTDDCHSLAGTLRNNDEEEAPSGTGQPLEPLTVAINSLDLNITPDKSLEDNVSTGVSVPEQPSPDSVVSGQGGASHIDSKPTHPGDKAAEESADDVLVVDLPFTVIDYLSKEMDIGPNYGKGWIELAHRKGYVYSRVNRIEGNRRIESPFKFLLVQQEFSGYTYRELKQDLKIIPRLDILRQLERGSFL